ncbi:hypothetical protein [Oligoflexus tunisiensis]|uniref:hypothetical protein n=1 Tax=Oligoflexus tunisiensis TaxID=708132 RepID=UPI001C403301|nr:hypothetical protein [Oligoflexus tunisiensis]
MQTGCGPQGEVARVIHPPLNLGGREARDPSAKTIASFQRTRPGLPPRCRLEVRVKDTFCISCDEGGTDIERCYAFRGVFDEVGNCVHSTEHIKCLNVTPPFALNIALKGSLEKSLVENTRMWQESLRAIAKPELNPELQAALEQGMEQTGQLVAVLVKAGKPPQWMDEALPQLTPPLKKAVAALQQQKEAGQLKLLQVLQVSRQILEVSGTPATVLPYWEALSVEGLEEPREVEE